MACLLFHWEKSKFQGSPSCICAHVHSLLVTLNEVSMFQAKANSKTYSLMNAGHSLQCFSLKHVFPSLLHYFHTCSSFDPLPPLATTHIFFACAAILREKFPKSCFSASFNPAPTKLLSSLLHQECSDQSSHSRGQFSLVIFITVFS